MNYKDENKMKHLTLGAIGFIAFCFVANSVKADTTVQDHYKNVIQKKPYTVEVCYEGSGDKTGDTLLGAIIGGAIGQNITKDLPDGATAGAIIGGILGNQNSTASGTYCKTETRFNEESRTMYSHSTITFVYEGKQYKLNFKK
tara:strand:+ start:1165 stop:1593 length:429 start_codon:yes stop_codon:yes gene_type:complete